MLNPKEYLGDESLKSRFWKGVEKTNYCWLWKKTKTKRGYGQIGYRRRGILYTHRLSYELHYGEIPDGLQVCHVCDNPPCVNPEHLFLGTHLDNMRDAQSKGRINYEHAKHLSDSQVRELVYEYIYLQHHPIDVAKRFGIQRSHVTRLARGEERSELWTEEEIKHHKFVMSKRNKHTKYVLE